MTLRTIASVGALALLVGSVSPPAAGAVFMPFYEFQHSPGVCQPAREYPLARVRPVEIDNIGTTNVYVVCAPSHHANPLDGETYWWTIHFWNAGEVDRVVKCTMHNGSVSHGLPREIETKQVSIAPSVGSFISFDNDAFQANINSSAVQCILPPGVSMSYIVKYGVTNYGRLFD